jgi:hypothetical protein
MPHDINSQQSFDALPLKPNGQRKTWERMTKFHLIQRSSGIKRLAEFTNGAFWNMPLQPDQ